MPPFSIFLLVPRSPASGDIAYIASRNWASFYEKLRFSILLLSFCTVGYWGHFTTNPHPSAALNQWTLDIAHWTLATRPSTSSLHQNKPNFICFVATDTNIRVRAFIGSIGCEMKQQWQCGDSDRYPESLLTATFPAWQLLA